MSTALAEIDRRIEAQRTERKVRDRARQSFGWFAEHCLKIAVKEVGQADAVRSLTLNDAQEFVHAKIEAQARRIGKVRVIVLKGRQQGVCLAPETAILRSDFTWDRLENIHAGDRLVSIDEGPVGVTAGGRNETRRMRTAIVEAKIERAGELFELILSNGTRLRATAEHRWLTRQRGGDRALWRQVKDLKIGDVLRAATYEPHASHSFEDGWIAGVLDADGSCAKTAQPRVSFSQVAGPVLDRYKVYLDQNGVGYYETVDRRTKAGEYTKLGDKPVHCVRVDRFADIVWLLGRARTVRFDTEAIFEGRKLATSSLGFDAWPQIVSIRSLGVQRVIDLQTNTKTFIAEGIVSHNSTYTEGRFYWKVTHRSGVKAFILTHQQKATDNLFAMVDRYHKNCPPMFRPHVGKSNQTELEFDRLDSRYTVATAGSKGAGRSATVHYFHGSEVAFWEHAEDHMSGALQAVPDAPGTEIILESTANGIGNEFHRLCTEAQKGNSDFELIFVPWFWQREYRSEAGPDFQISDTKDDVPAGELTEFEYAQVYKLQPEQVAWRRKKIAELSYWSFKREYPATVAEAFQASGDRTLIPINLLVKARKLSVAAHGSLVIGLDPAGKGKDHTAFIRRKGRKMWGGQLFSKLTAPQIVGLAVKIIRVEKPKHLFVDVGGLGGPICDYLLENETIPRGVVVPVNFGATDTLIQPERFRNKKAEMYWSFAEWFEDPAGVDIPDGEIGDLLQAQAQQIMFTTDGAQRLVIRSKEELRAKGIPSPDLFDAGALTFAWPVAGDDKMAEVMKDIEAGWPASHFGLGDMPLPNKEPEGWDAL